MHLLLIAAPLLVAAVGRISYITGKDKGLEIGYRLGVNEQASESTPPAKGPIKQDMDHRICSQCGRLVARFVDDNGVVTCANCQNEVIKL